MVASPTSPTVRLSVVFLNFNRLNETRLTLEHLRSLSCQRSDMEIIAIDNGSQDGTGEYLRRQEGVITVFLGENEGIAGYNHGFAKASGDYILVLDDDSCPRDGETIDRIITLLDGNPQIGIIACHIQGKDGKPQWSWHLPPGRKFGPSPFFVGCGFAVRRHLFAHIGWYPEKFFLYQNEIDVAFRVKKNDYLIYYDPDCRIIHRGEPSTRPGKRRIYYPTRNTIWLIKRYFPQPIASYMIFSRLVIGLLRAVYFRELSTYRKAVVDAFKEPVSREILPPQIRKEAAPFYRQNSLIHQLLKLT